jgi:hypothetical protein
LRTIPQLADALLLHSYIYVSGKYTVFLMKWNTFRTHGSLKNHPNISCTMPNLPSSAESPGPYLVSSCRLFTTKFHVRSSSHETSADTLGVEAPFDDLVGHNCGIIILNQIFDFW